MGIIRRFRRKDSLEQLSQKGFGMAKRKRKSSARSTARTRARSELAICNDTLKRIANTRVTVPPHEVYGRSPAMDIVHLLSPRDKTTLSELVAEGAQSPIPAGLNQKLNEAVSKASALSVQLASINAGMFGTEPKAQDPTQPAGQPTTTSLASEVLKHLADIEKSVASISSQL